MGSTAIISDLHIGGRSGEALLAHASIRELLLEEIRSAERVVFLGDAIELRELPLGQALENARPFLEAIGQALGGAEIVLVPGNHDHHLAAPLLEELATANRQLGLEGQVPAVSAPVRLIARWLQPAALRVAYPGTWIRDDVYATHGHYMDLHLTLPRLECIASAAVARVAGRFPDPAGPADYERFLGPASGFLHGLAQSGAWRRGAGRGNRPSERAWTYLAGRPGGGLRHRLGGRVATTVALPIATGALNRALGTRFEPDLTVAAINRGGIAAATELARRLGIEASHVIMGHSHHAGPAQGAIWPLAGGGELHNTGNWIFSRVLHAGSDGQGPFWPGTVTWIDESGPPRRVFLLDHLRPADLGELVVGARGGA